MSDAAQSQAIMFEPTDEEDLRISRGELDSRERGQAEIGQEAYLEGFGAKEDDQLEPGQKDSVQTREQITFEQGYEELKGIVSRLDDPELPVHEMFEGFRRGKGLEKALRAYLQEREGELAELEEGNNLPQFEIASPSNGPVAG
ncbi:MAG TPA: exodeoxyribonuclease VII small subunit [Solirubrobacteraceae bacterium]|jgi:exodeoxyribonuclease VII small subunit|nr:exodeoxyribonuclease VII small subunit [Solirubrobacteraceae bacterium]